MLDRFFKTLFIDYRGQVIRVLQGQPMDSQLNMVVDRYGEILLPPGEPLADSADRLREFLSINRFKATKTVVGIGQGGIICRSTRVPKVSVKDLHSMMQLNISEHLPVSVEEYALDYKVLDVVEEEDREYLDLMLAAIPHQQVETCATLLEQAGLNLLAIDILPNMLHYLLKHQHYANSLVVDGGQDGTHVVIFKGKSLFMYADIPFKTNTADFSILYNELRGYLEYFASRNYGRTVDGITVWGELATLPDIAVELEGQFALPVTTGIEQIGPINFIDQGLGFATQAGVYAGNLGLMMRGNNRQSSVAITSPMSHGASPSV